MSDTPPPHFDAIVFAGGRGSRLGGTDKAALLLQGTPLVDRVIDAARKRGASRVIVTGPAEAGTQADAQVREDPPFSGPLAALGAGAGAVEAPWAMLLACDLVHPDSVVDQLRAALAARLARSEAACDPDDHDTADTADADTGITDGFLLVDAEGSPQWLASIVRTDALRRALDLARDHRGTLADGPLRAALGEVRLERVGARPGSTADIDTPEQLARAREMKGEGQ